MFRVALSALMLSISPAAFTSSLNAQESEAAVSLRGFGTLGAVYHSGGEAGFRRDITQPTGARNSLNTDIDSRLGVQLDIDWTDRLDATVQVLTRYGYDGRYRPELTWGFLRYKPQPDFEVRLGRLGWDVYMLSDAREVGYSYLWVRPPVEYYGHLQLSKITGADVVWRRSLGDAVVSGKVFAGEVTSRIPLDKQSYSTLAGSWLYGGYLDYQQGGWHARLGLTRLKLKTELRGDAARQLVALREQYGPALQGLLDLTRQDTSFYMATAGIAYDRGPVQTQVMYAYTDTRNTAGFSEMHMGYISLGYRVGRWTPYLMLSALKAAEPSSSPGAGYSEIDFSGAFMAMTNMRQYTIALGARYELSSRVALKFQVERITVNDPAEFVLLWNSPDPGWNGRATVLSTTVDFAF